MNKKVEDFLLEVKDQKVKQLMGIALDIKYWTKTIGDANEESKLREEMEKENSKRTFKKNGEVLKDERDLPKVKVLQGRIDEITRAKQEIDKLKQMQSGINQYLGYVTNPPEELTKELEEVSLK